MQEFSTRTAPHHWSVGLLFLLTAAVPSVANASSIIYSTFGPGDTYGATGISTGSVGFYAIAFTPTADRYLSTVEVVMFAELSTGTFFFNINLYDNGAGIPGTLLETWSPGSIGGGGIFLRNSVSHPLLFAGQQYWLQTVAPDDTLVWRLNSEGFEALRWGFPNNTPILAPAPAFRLTGDDPVTPVPEPATLLLLASGMLGIAAWRWRRAARTALALARSKQCRHHRRANLSA